MMTALVVSVYEKTHTHRISGIHVTDTISVDIQKDLMKSRMYPHRSLQMPLQWLHQLTQSDCVNGCVGSIFDFFVIQRTRYTLNRFINGVTMTYTLRVLHTVTNTTIITITVDIIAENNLRSDILLEIILSLSTSYLVGAIPTYNSRDAVIAAHIMCVMNSAQCAPRVFDRTPVHNVYRKWATISETKSL